MPQHWDIIIDAGTTLACRWAASRIAPHILSHLYQDHLNLATIKLHYYISLCIFLFCIVFVRKCPKHIRYSKLSPSGQITDVVRSSVWSIFFGPNSFSVKAIS